MGAVKPVFYTLEMNDGSEVEISRNYAGLLLLRGYNEKLYETSQMNHTDKVPDDIDNARILYSAYVTAKLMRKQPDIMDELEFLTLAPTGSEYVNDIFCKLFGISQKKVLSLQPLSGKREEWLEGLVNYLSQNSELTQ